MSAAVVLSGQYDIKDVASTEGQSSDSELEDLKSLLFRLKEEHADGFVYRGQTREWPGPLLPSIYRGIVKPERYTGWHHDSRLRNVGNVFHELSSTPMIEYSDKKQAQIHTVKYLRQMLGYPMSQLLAQQCGLTSEGLDVTYDPEIAAFFAVYDFSSNNFVDSKGTGVIYRFKIEANSHNITNFKEYDFYTCPSYLSPDVLRLFDLCKNPKDSLNSFFDYVKQYMINGYDSMTPERPLELLKMPIHALECSRVVQQCAGLLIPDMILTDFYAKLGKAAPAKKAVKKGENAIEDLAMRNGTDKFVFRHTHDSKRYIKAYSQRVFPKKDVFKDMLMVFLERTVGKIQFITELGSFGNPSRYDLLE